MPRALLTDQPPCCGNLELPHTHQPQQTSNGKSLHKNVTLCVCSVSHFRRLIIRGFSGESSTFIQLNQPDSLHGALTTAKKTDQDLKDGKMKKRKRKKCKNVICN